MKFNHSTSYFYMFTGEDFTVEFDFTDNMASGDIIGSSSVSIIGFDGIDYTYLPLNDSIGKRLNPFIADLIKAIGKTDDKVHKIIINLDTGQINIICFEEYHKDSEVYKDEFNKLVKYFEGVY